MMRNNAGRHVATLSVVLAGFGLSGCISDPTYGTGTGATAQLVDDLASAVTIRPQQGADIEYTPRPAIVTPPSTDTLPPPQTSVAESEQWPESPEETRARLVAEADANAGRAGYRSPLLAGTTPNRPVQEIKIDARDPGLILRRADRERLRGVRQERLASVDSAPTTRQFLSEPPVEYRQPAATAPVGEFGETERSKERRRLQAAQSAEGGGRRWWPF